MFSSNVALETKINNNVSFFSLDDDMKDIIKIIDKTCKEEKIVDRESFKNRGFDIKNEAKKLDDYYKGKIRK